MKLALKYGLLITAGVIAWVLLAHLLVPDPRSPVHSLGAFVFFNALEFVSILLGMQAQKREQGEKPEFKEALKLGVSISFVYALTASLFFAGVLIVVGPKWLQGATTAQSTPIWLTALQAFAGLCVFALVLGLVYSTLIAFALARRRSRS